MNHRHSQPRVITKENGLSPPIKLDKSAHRDTFVLDQKLITNSISGGSSPSLSRSKKNTDHETEFTQDSFPVQRSYSLGQANFSSSKFANSSKPQSQHDHLMTPQNVRKNQRHAQTLGQSSGRQAASRLLLSPKAIARHSFKSSSSSISTASSSTQSLGSMSSVNSIDDNRTFKFKQTHIAVYKFISRHGDEIDFDLGDAIQVEKKYDDLWFEGMNLRTGKYGVFPSRYVADVLASRSPSPTLPRGKDVKNADILQVDCQQFLLRFLGSIEVNDFKGNEVICDAMKEIAKKHQGNSGAKPVHCSVEVSVKGVKVVDFGAELPQAKKQNKLKLGKLFEKEQKEFPEHFFELKNVTFCGCHPQNPRYFGFITKHPEERRFACHVFMSENSTEPVARAIGEAFKEFYAQFLDQSAMAEEFPDVET